MLLSFYKWKAALFAIMGVTHSKSSHRVVDEETVITFSTDRALLLAREGRC